MKLIVEVGEAERMPVGYGIFMRHWHKRTALTCPIGLNVLFYFTVEIYVLMRHLPETWRTWNLKRSNQPKGSV